MHENPTGDLRQLHEDFGGVAKLFDAADPERTDLSALRSAWANYYLGPFARFDARLQALVGLGDRRAYDLISISITHHNLERLFEVLVHELRDRDLSDTRIPERVLDLSEVLTGLTSLLQEAAKTRL